MRLKKRMGYLPTPTRTAPLHRNGAETPPGCEPDGVAPYPDAPWFSFFRTPTGGKRVHNQRLVMLPNPCGAGKRRPA